MSLSIDEDIAETQKFLSVVTRPVVQDRLIQLLGSLQQVLILQCQLCCTLAMCRLLLWCLRHPRRLFLVKLVYAMTQVHIPACMLIT